MKEIKKDLRYRKTRECIHATFRRLLQEVGYDKITVTMLTQQAKINRKTFYLHYDTLEELLNELSSEIVQKGVKQLLDYTLPQDLRKMIDTIFRYWQSLTADDELIFRTASASPQCLAFSQHMRNTFHNFSPDFCGGREKEQIAAVVFMVNAMGTLYREWTVNHAVDTLEEAVEMSYRMIGTGLEE